MRNEECAWTVESWPAYEDAELAPRERAQLEGHLSLCAGCRVATQEMRGAWATFQLAHAPQEMPAAPDRDWSVSTSALTLRKTLWPWAAAAGLAMAALMVHQTPASRGTARDEALGAATSLDPRAVELTLSLGRQPEDLSAAWAREIGGAPNE